MELMEQFRDAPVFAVAGVHSTLRHVEGRVEEAATGAPSRVVTPETATLSE